MRFPVLSSRSKNDIMTGVYSVRGDEPIFEVEHVSEVLVLQLIANPAAANYRSKQFEYNRLMKALSEPETRHLLFDFRACQKLDSVSMGIVIALTLRIRELGGNAAICCCSDEISRMVARLNATEPLGQRSEWTHYPTRRHAVETLCAEAN
ncbi:MAG: anti-anti-sigma regulatory factor [Planctomycetaceae bacterium]|jgi:anti-anti-sigma regulatory factor